MWIFILRINLFIKMIRVWIKYKGKQCRSVSTQKKIQCKTESTLHDHTHWLEWGDWLQFCYFILFYMAIEMQETLRYCYFDDINRPPFHTIFNLTENLLVFTKLMDKEVWVFIFHIHILKTHIPCFFWDVDYIVFVPAQLC